jgi:REP element-mobilizing transposase RayT
MTQPRKQLISVEDTPYYHLTSRCVRRAFLCGKDINTGQCYEHRRQWIVDRIRLLSSVFSIDICSYSVMHNHYHLAVKIDSSDNLSREEVIQRWLTLYKGPLIVQRLVRGDSLSKPELDTVDDIVVLWREHLQDVSWFMKCLNEPIAREANKEDNCTGHFWESRFKSQALRSEESLLSCMVYVDLNPIRSKMADTPETSDYTSVQERINPKFDLSEAIKGQSAANEVELPIKPLLHFDGVIKNETQTGLPFALLDYLQLINWTGRAIRDDKRGHIPHHLPNILHRLGVAKDDWLTNSQRFEEIIHRRFRKTA